MQKVVLVALRVESGKTCRRRERRRPDEGRGGAGAAPGWTQVRYWAETVAQRRSERVLYHVHAAPVSVGRSHLVAATRTSRSTPPRPPATAVPDVSEGFILVSLRYAPFSAFLEVLAMSVG